MKKLKLIIHQYSINKLIGRELELSLNDDANILDAIKKWIKLYKVKEAFLRETMGVFYT